MRFRIAVPAGFLLAACFCAQAAASPGFTVAGPASATTIENPSTHQVNIIVSPVNGFAGGVNFTSCVVSAGPSGAMNSPICGIFGPAMKPPTVTISNANAVSFLLTVATAGEPVPVFRRADAWLSAGTAVFACLLLFFPASRRRGWKTLLGLTLAIASVSVGCGGAARSFGSGSPPGNYMFAVTCSDAATGMTHASGSFQIIIQ